MGLFVSKESIQSVADYFRSKDYSKPEQIGLFLYFKAVGLNSFGYTTYKKWGEFDADERERYMRNLYDLAGIFDATRENGLKYTALFPFSITRSYKTNSFYNGGSVFKTLGSRISDTLDNALVSTIIKRDSGNKNNLMFSGEYLDYIMEKQLKGQSIPLSQIAAWCYKYWSIEGVEELSDREFTDVLILAFLRKYHISENEFTTLFALDNKTVSSSSTKISSSELLPILNISNPECSPVIQDGETSDYMPAYEVLPLSFVKHMLELRGDSLTRERIIEILKDEDEKLRRHYFWETKTDLEKAILQCWENKQFNYVEVEPLYTEFRNRFGKDAIASLDSKAVLYLMFGKKDNDSLVYNLEHVGKYNYFGGVTGYRTVYTLYEKDGQWKYGANARNIESISEERACEIASAYRDSFVQLFEVIDNMLDKGELNELSGFATLQEKIKSILGTVLYNRNWVWKYLHMLYPTLFMTTYSSEWVNKVFRVAKIVPESNYTLQCGQFSLYAKNLELLNVYLYHILVALDDAEEREIDDIPVSDELEGVDNMADVVTVSLPELSPRTRKKYPLNSILYGAPGTGKTYSTAQYAVAIAQDLDYEEVANTERKSIMQQYNSLIKAGRIVFTTFHQNYGYEDFIQGIRPDTSNGGMSFKNVDGVFKTIADRAMGHPGDDFVIIIDEINRANISKVFGELITLIEDDKRWGEVNAIDATLPSGDVFAVPNNLYIIGTMNSADKSISLIDTALRRRFDFVEYEPKAELVADDDLRKVLVRLNSGISTELGSTDLLIGHSYFMNRSVDDLCDIMNRNIIPLLYEYFFDNQKKVEAQVKAAIDGYPIDVLVGTVGRIKLKKKVVE